jgi:Spy/CpxP family protein refolding chaperone
MRTRVITCLLALLFFVAARGAAQEQQQQRHKWWQDDKIKADLGLTDQQSSEVEAIFQAALPRLRAGKKQLDDLETDLSRLISERSADEATVMQQIDRVEAARSDLNKTRTLMLYHMHRILTPEQNTKLQALHDQMERDHGRKPTEKNEQ